MVIIDAPYASEPILTWLASSRHPVLANGFARSLVDAGADLNLVDEDEAARRIAGGERVYSNSENALSWVLEHGGNADLSRAITLFKDKAAVRELLAPINPGLFYRTFSRGELAGVRAEELPLPVVLKPSVGFCSMGVYVIERPDDWERALADIAAAEAVWNERYPESVVDGGTYIVEGYITGTEYALDAYFDAEGAPHLLNVLRHDFAGAEDTSDRLYLTSADIVAEMAPCFLAWLTEVNAVTQVHDFPAHIEVRVGDAGIVPIEFNPLRFAGLCGTDIAWHAWGLRTYEAYLEDRDPDIVRMAAAHPGKTFSMSLLNPAPDADLDAALDYDALAARFARVLALTRFDVRSVGSYGFLFLETDEASRADLDFILHSDLREFEKPAARAEGNAQHAAAGEAGGAPVEGAAGAGGEAAASEAEGAGAEATEVSACGADAEPALVAPRLEGFASALGIRVTRAERECVEAVMPITDTIKQPFGFVHGGATLALLESVASLGTQIACDLDAVLPFGVHVDVVHRKPGVAGSVRGVARFDREEPSHGKAGGYKHYWAVTAYDDGGDVMSEGVVVIRVVPRTAVAGV